MKEPVESAWLKTLLARTEFERKRDQLAVNPSVRWSENMAVLAQLKRRQIVRPVNTWVRRVLNRLRRAGLAYQDRQGCWYPRK